VKTSFSNQSSRILFTAAGASQSAQCPATTSPLVRFLKCRSMLAAISGRSVWSLVAEMNRLGVLICSTGSLEGLACADVGPSTYTLSSSQLTFLVRYQFTVLLDGFLPLTDNSRVPWSPFLDHSSA
jgi:hypothetical protein